MIYTCTLNPSIDYQIQADTILLGQLNRVEKTSFYPGGKGINVSRVLKNFHIDSIALGFIGGFTGAFLKHELSEVGIMTGFIEHEEPTRVNLKIKTINEETEINGTGVFVSERQQQELLNKLRLINGGDYLVISGSKPSSIPFSFYKTIVQTVSKKNVRLILDIPDRYMCQLLRYKPMLIKPNEHELAELTGRNIHHIGDVIESAKELIKMGAQNVIVSRGENGAILVHNQQIFQAVPPEGKLVSSVGAGDSLVAGFIAAYEQNNNIVQAFKYGVAAGSATAYSQNLCEQKEVERLLEKVIVYEWKGE